MMRHALPALLLAAVPAACLAGEIATVTLGGVAKPTTGTVVSLVNGDTACGVELRDDAGETRYESADFDLCFQQPSLVGRRVEFTWTMANVIAESCMGDPECAESERIPLISGARIIDDAAAPAPLASFCTADEDVIFACRTGAKMVSVCAASGASAATGYAQYRFGRPDPATPRELELPATRKPAAEVATADHIAFAAGGASWMRFRRGDHAYVVYSGIGNWGPDGEVAERAGIVVERRGERIAALRCNDDAASGELGPDWFAKVGLTAKGEEFELPE